jgi:hypothetical protein
VDQFASALLALGFAPGEIEVPAAHQHHYRKEFDAHSASLLAEYE